MHGESANLVAGWMGILAGVIAGAVAGLFFHRDDWLGGYGSYPRRMVRLGHIAFFGIGFINLAFALSTPAFSLAVRQQQLASLSLILGLITMPACCFLSAWRKPFRHLFPIPVICVLTGLALVIIGLGGQ